MSNIQRFELLRNTSLIEGVPTGSDEFFSETNFTYIQRAVTQRLTAWHPTNKTLTIADEQIKKVMDGIYEKTRNKELSNLNTTTIDFLYDYVTSDLEMQYGKKSWFNDPHIMEHQSEYGIKRGGDDARILTSRKISTQFSSRY